jgi:hypothetical protein
MQASSSCKSSGGGHLARTFRGLLATPHVVAIVSSLTTSPALPTIPDIQRQNVTDTEAQESAAWNGYQNRQQGCEELFAAKERTAADRARNYYYATMDAVNKADKEKACHTLVDQYEDEVVKYIFALIDGKASNAEKLWVALDMDRFNEGMAKCEEALGGRKTIMDRFGDVLPKRIVGGGKK